MVILPFIHYVTMFGVPTTADDLKLDLGFAVESTRVTEIRHLSRSGVSD